MIKYSLITLLLALANNMNAQIIEAGKRIDSIPLYGFNRQFMAVIDNKLNELKENNTDSMLLYYRFDSLSNYAVVFWKKGTCSQSIAFYQFNTSSQEIVSEVLQNNTVNKIFIGNLFDIMRRDDVRSFDPSNLFEDPVIYCKFSFNKTSVIFDGYETKIHKRLSIDFVNAFASERGRIIRRELKKNNLRRQ